MPYISLRFFTMQQRKLVIYIAMSLDGYIATTDDGLDFLSVVEQEGEDYGYNDFVATIDTVIIGRRTYDKVMAMGHSYPDADGKRFFIITHTARPATGNTTFYTGSLPDLVKELKATPGKNIYCDGGAEVINQLMKDKLIDEYIISVIPIFLGDGIRLFKDGRPQAGLKLISSKAFNKGLVQLHYING